MGEIAQARKDLDFMPDALKIIPGVVEEMQEQDQDQMEIDSRNGRGSTQDDTLAACVQCLLQCFNPTAGSGEGRSPKAPKAPKAPKFHPELWEPPSVIPC